MHRQMPSALRCRQGPRKREVRELMGLPMALAFRAPFSVYHFDLEMTHFKEKRHLSPLKEVEIVKIIATLVIG